jgi:hypothetical protein
LKLSPASAVSFDGFGGVESRAPIRAAVQDTSIGINGSSATVRCPGADDVDVLNPMSASLLLHGMKSNIEAVAAPQRE